MPLSLNKTHRFLNTVLREKNWKGSMKIVSSACNMTNEQNLCRIVMELLCCSLVRSHKVVFSHLNL